MIHRDKRCVHVASNNGEARVIAAWLTGEGFTAEVMDEMTRGGFEGLTAILPGGISARGLEVWVLDPDQADAARAVVEQRRNQLGERAAAVGEIVATCEDCGRPSTFAAAQAGAVETCPHCGSYIDVPDPDAEMIDVGECEDESVDAD